MLLDFTIDRVSLFALIFSIGILVDDAIVVVENIYRRWLEEGKTDMETAVDAVREVGNPTILATLTVIGALLPMGAVTGMMGPYMLPIPVLGSVAMVISLFAAFVFTPWFAIHGMFRPTMHYLKSAEKREHKEAEWLEGLYRRMLMPMILRSAQGPPVQAGHVGRAAPDVFLLLLQVGGGEDAAARQQAGILGGARHARGHGARRYRQHGAHDRRTSAPYARGDCGADLCRYRAAVRFQRHGPALLPAPVILAGARFRCSC